MDTYSFVRRPSDIPRVICAVVDLPENAVFLNFLETTARNAGLLLNCFTDIDDARAWLNGYYSNPGNVLSV
jgi:hypothetical protein